MVLVCILPSNPNKWDALNADYADKVAAFRMQNAANECQIQELMEQVQEKTLQSEQLRQIEASHNSLVENLHGRQSQLRSTENKLETVKYELAGKKVELGNEKLAKPTMIQALNANAVKLKNQRGDQLQSESRVAVRDMLTGDSMDMANNIQRKLGPIDVPAQLFPEDKVELLKQLKAVGLTGMVGDRINDAPTLAAVDVGIAMGVAAVGYASLWGVVLADVGSEVRDSLQGDSSEGDVESVKYQELASYAPAHGIVRSQDFSSKEGRHVEIESAPIRHLDEHEDERDMILQYYSEEWGHSKESSQMDVTRKSNLDMGPLAQLGVWALKFASIQSYKHFIAEFQNCSFNNTYLLEAT
ncbi:hypothetical protein L7F22_005911 [Adiantum nelumboides]|nr:hypothetical protein [Adiantum nelumboides]